MSSETLSLKDSLMPFFGESEKALLFFNANYESSDYSNPINTKAQPDEIVGKKIFEMMLAKNYSLENGMSENDIHYEFTDFIVRTALLHKEFDRSTGVNPAAQKMKASFDDAIDRSLNDPITMNDLQQINFTQQRMSDNNNHYEDDNNPPVIQTTRVGATATGLNSNGANATFSTRPRGSTGSTGATGFADGIQYGGNENTREKLRHLLFIGNNPNRSNPTYYQFLCAAVFILAGIIGEVQKDTLFDSASFKEIHLRELEMKVGQYLADLIGKCDDDMSNCSRSHFGRLCLMNNWNNNGENSAVVNLNALLSRAVDQGGLTAGKRTSILKNFQREMHNIFLNVITVFAMKVLNKLYIYDSTRETADPQNMTIEMFQKIAFNDAELKKSLYSTLKQGANNIFKKTAALVGVKNFQKITGNNFASEFCRNVFGNWARLDKQARSFYSSQIGVFRKNKKTLSLPQDQTGWSFNLIESDNEMSKLDCDKEDLRLNLMKESEGSDVVMFAHTLPYLPTKLIGKLWYTDADGQRRSIENANLNQETLKTIYDQVYKQDTTINPSHRPVINIEIGKQKMILPGDYLIVQPNTDQWSLNLKSVVKNIIDCHNKSTKSYSGKIQNVLFDMDTGMEWFSNSDGLYTIVDGKKLSYGEWKEKVGYNCENTLALDKNKISSEGCEEVAKCILLSPDRLPECLKKLNSYDMFDVAQNGLSKLDPHIARDLLKVFHVNLVEPSVADPRYGTPIIKPMSYNDWFDLVVNGQYLPKGWTNDFKKVLLKNEALTNYVKGVIEFVKANPAILNEGANIPSKDLDELEDEQIIQLRNTRAGSIGHYTHPVDNTLAEFQFNSGFLLQTANAVAFKPQLMDMNSPFTNGFIGDGSMEMNTLNSMGGGAMPTEEGVAGPSFAKAGSNLMSIVDDLRRSGLTFRQDTVKGIEEIITNLVMTEKKVNQLFKVLKMMKNLQSFVNCHDNGKYAGVTSGKVLNIEEIVSNKDLLAYLNYNIGDYEKCIYTSMKYLNSGSQQILQSYFDIIQSASKK
jgi:hypothetical protein